MVGSTKEPTRLGAVALRKLCLVNQGQVVNIRHRPFLSRI